MAITRRSSRSDRLRLAAQGEGQVGVQAALVELVEDHAADPVERRVVLQQPEQDAVGHHLDAGRGPTLLSIRTR